MNQTQQIADDLAAVIGAMPGDPNTMVVGAAWKELQRLDQLINSPHVVEFLEAVRLEAAHQVLRWGDDHDRSKSAENWLFLVGYLASKACRAQIEGDREKALHHTISSAAALMHWHAFIKDDDSCIGLGRDEDLEAICDKFGLGMRSSYRCYSLGESGTELFIARNIEQLSEWIASQGGEMATPVAEISMMERVLEGPGSERTCTILEALATRLLGGDAPPFQLVTRFA
jgi:hypothetical protein